MVHAIMVDVYKCSPLFQDINKLGDKPMVGVVYDEHMTKHRHKQKHVESPDRVQVPYHMMQQSGLLDKCLTIPAR